MDGSSNKNSYPTSGTTWTAWGIKHQRWKAQAQRQQHYYKVSNINKCNSSSCSRSRIDSINLLWQREAIKSDKRWRPETDWSNKWYCCSIQHKSYLQVCSFSRLFFFGSFCCFWSSQELSILLLLLLAKLAKVVKVVVVVIVESVPGLVWSGVAWLQWLGCLSDGTMISSMLSTTFNRN